jgi:hypothetical protein
MSNQQKIKRPQTQNPGSFVGVRSVVLPIALALSENRGGNPGEVAVNLPWRLVP